EIRRFIIVKSRRGFCIVLPIDTYGDCATLSPGMRPSEHAFIFTRGSESTFLDGESGIHKEPIMVEPSLGTKPLDPCSRINYRIQRFIHYNSLIRDEDIVCRDDIPNLIGCWREESDEG
ncbi:hypothetical protein P154DRAFT_430890, partial [Amniculicola lignicola CBS 123094]